MQSKALPALWQDATSSTLFASQCHNAAAIQLAPVNSAPSPSRRPVVPSAASSERLRWPRRGRRLMGVGRAGTREGVPRAPADAGGGGSVRRGRHADRDRGLLPSRGQRLPPGARASAGRRGGSWPAAAARRARVRTSGDARRATGSFRARSRTRPAATVSSPGPVTCPAVSSASVGLSRRPPPGRTTTGSCAGRASVSGVADSARTMTSPSIAWWERRVTAAETSSGDGK